MEEIMENPGEGENSEEENEYTPEELKQMRTKAVIREILDWVGVIVTALVISLFLNFCIIVNAKVPSGSMETTIMTGDRLFGGRLSYVFSDPKRGDIVIFKFPDDEKVLYIKRVIGLPGDKVEIKNGGVYINDEKLKEDYLSVVTEGEFGPYEVPEGYYFMMGDNRNNSADSRYWKNTYLARDKIVGKALLKYYPKFELLKSGEYE